MPLLWILSDLHEEISPDAVRRFEPPEFDILVCAGDVCEGDVRGCIDGVARVADGRPAVMVLGNHDLYGLPIDRAALVAQRIGEPLGIHVVERSAVEVGGLRFAGGTLWQSVAHPGEGRADLTKILSGAEPALFSPAPTAPYGEPVQVEDRNGVRPATYADIAARRMHTLAAIAASRPDVVVTHYPPTREDVSYAGGAGTWIHGHTHTVARQMIDGVDVMVNAAPSRLFAERMVVEVERRPSSAPGPTS
jgi:predicted phosphodiesterase